MRAQSVAVLQGPCRRDQPARQPEGRVVSDADRHLDVGPTNDLQERTEDFSVGVLVSLVSVVLLRNDRFLPVRR